jgi:hypothetical protein
MWNGPKKTWPAALRQKTHRYGSSAVVASASTHAYERSTRISWGGTSSAGGGVQAVSAANTIAAPPTQRLNIEPPASHSIVRL